MDGGGWRDSGPGADGGAARDEPARRRRQPGSGLGAPERRGGPGRRGGLAEIPFSSFCESVVADVCRALISCEGAPYRSLDDCEHNQICARGADLGMEGLSGWVSYDPAAAGACAARLEAAPCDFGSFFFVPTVHQVLALCPGVVTGHQGSGDPCADDVDCADGLFCAMSGSTCPGTCTPKGMEGDSCADSTQCAVSLVCHEGGTCGAPFSAGDSCASVAARDDCFNDGLWCEHATSICREPVGEGASCDVFGQVGRCGDGLRCVSLDFHPGPVGRRAAMVIPAAKTGTAPRR